jgi:hypothetical protein
MAVASDMPQTRLDPWLMAGVIAVGAAITIAFGERIGVNGGLGWDGSAYGAWAQVFWPTLERGLSAFQAQRILPSGIIYYALGAIGAPRSTINVIHAFQVYDALLMVTVAFTWSRIASLVGLSRRVAWVGLVALFGGYGLARCALYYPCQTDMTGFALAAGMVWAYLARQSVVLFVLIALSLVSWPSLPLVGAVLLVMRRPRQPLGSAVPRWLPAAAIAVGAAAALLVAALSYHYVVHVPYGQQLRWVQDIQRPWWPLSAVIVLAYVGLGVHALARRPEGWQLRAYARDVGWRHAVLAIAGLAALYYGQHRIIAYITRTGYGAGQGATPGEYIGLILLQPLRAPAFSAVMMVVYYGPILLIAMACWRQIAAVIAAWGPGALVVAAIVIAQTLGSESRQFIHLIPFVVTATMVATQDRWRSTPLVATFVALSVVWSKVWFRIGYDRPINPKEFPNQRFIMHNGPWAAIPTYLVHGACAVVTAAILWLVWRRARGDAAAAPTGAAA